LRRISVLEVPVVVSNEREEQRDHLTCFRATISGRLAGCSMNIGKVHTKGNIPWSASGLVFPAKCHADMRGV